MGKTRRERLSRKHDKPMGATAKERALTRIKRDRHLPRAVKSYLYELMERKPITSVLTINMFMRTIPQIIVGKDIAKRRRLDEFLARKGGICSKPMPITAAEKKRYKKELIEDGFFTEREVGRIMQEIEARSGLSELGAHAIVHYFLCSKILDRIQRRNQ